MAATAPIADWAISAFGPPEIFALVFFGLAVAASVGAKTFWKGWLSILAGLMVAVVGLDPVGDGMAHAEHELCKVGILFHVEIGLQTHAIDIIPHPDLFHDGDGSGIELPGILDTGRRQIVP